MSSDKVEAPSLEYLRERHGTFLVAIANAEERGTLPWQHHAGCELGLCIRFTKRSPDAHDFARRFHFRAEDRVRARELDERKDRLLHREIFGITLIDVTLLCERLADHDLGSNFCKREPDRFGHKRNGSRCARVDLEQVNHVVLDSELRIHQANDVQSLGKLHDLLVQFLLELLRQAERRQRATGIAGVNAGLLDMLHDAADQHAFTVADTVDIDFGSQIQESIEQHRACVRHADGRVHVRGEIFFAVDYFHRPAAQDVRRPDDERESYV